MPCPCRCILKAPLQQFLPALSYVLRRIADRAFYVQIYFGRDEVIILKNQQGIEAHILTLGAVVQRVLVPDNKAVLGDVVLGFDDLEPYQVGSLSRTLLLA